MLQMQMSAGLSHCTVSSKVLLLSISEFSIHSPACCVTVEQLEKNVISHKHSIHYMMYVLFGTCCSLRAHHLCYLSQPNQKNIVYISVYTEWSM